MSTIDKQCQEFASKRETFLKQLGKLEENVLSRLVPRMLWPSSALGKLRIVYRPESILVVTDGLSDPWDENLHQGNIPDWSFHFEAAIEVPMKGAPKELYSSIIESWIPSLLWNIADAIVHFQYDVYSLNRKFQVSTISIPPVSGFEAYVDDRGFLVGIVGMPILGELVGASVPMFMHDDGAPVFLWPVKILTLDEIRFAFETEDSSNTLLLANAFMRRGDRHLIIKDRDSVLPRK